MLSKSTGTGYSDTIAEKLPTNSGTLLRRVNGRIGTRLEILFAATCSNLLSLALPIVVLQVYDRVIPNNSNDTLALLLLGLAVVLALDALINLLRSHLSAWRGARIQHVLNCAAVQRILDSDFKAFSLDGPGVQLHRLYGIETLSNYYAGQEIQLRIDLPFAAVFAALIAAVSLKLAAVLIVVMLVLALAGSISGVYLRRALTDRSETDDLRHNFIIEMLRGIHTIKLIGAEALMHRRHERLQAAASESNYWVAFHSSVARVIGSSFSQIVIVVIGAFGGAMAMSGEMSIGGLAACTFLAGRTAQPLLRALGIWSRFQSYRLARTQLDEIFALPVRSSHSSADAKDLRGEVVVEDVTFGYNDDRSPLLEGMNLVARPGETIGITGNNGSGKSTFLRLVLGVMTPNEGAIRLDGIDVSAFARETLQQHVVYLPQDAILFQGTILDNMTLFTPSLAERAKGFADRLGLSEIIAGLAKGYETEIQDNPEESLPTGVSQRIAVVRALTVVQQPRIIIFDEANSHLDAEGDEALRQVLLDLRGQCTMILVSHRPSYLSLAERLFILRGGTLVPSTKGAREILAQLERQLA